LGLQDRDYMRDRNRKNLQRLLADVDRPFTPPPERSSFLVAALFWVALAFVLFKAYGWWLESRSPRQSARATVQRVEPQARPVVRVEEPSVPPQESSEARHERVASQPEVQQAMQPSQPQTSGTIYLCRAYAGGTFWASTHCNQHSALVERITSVPPRMPFEQQVQIAESRRQALQQEAVVSTTQVTNVPSQAAQNKALCTSLDERVNHLDAMARQPQSPSTQDWIRMERHKTRDEQFRLRC